MSKKMIIVENLGEGRTRTLEQFLSEKGLTMKDVIIVDNVADIENYKEEIMAQAPSETLSTKLNQKDFLIKPMPKFEDLSHISIEELNKHPFDKFIGGKKKKGKRR